MQELIKPLTIGTKTFKHNLIQGPLAGYSCAPFRKLFYQYTPPAYCVTEMISAHDLVHNKNFSSRYLWRDPVEKFLCYQLSGNCANTLRTAAQIVTDLGADIIDLNCGCPKPKIRKKQCGSYLLNQPDHIGELIMAMKSATTAPITVKIRVDGDSRETQHLAVAKAAAQAGADALIVHGRHWTEDYQTPCHLDQIKEITSSVTIPVIGNGDVRDIHSLKHMFATGCAGVMIARAGTGRPWIFQQLLQEISANPYLPPAFPELIQLFWNHTTGLAQLNNEHTALLESRKLLHYYFHDYFSPEKLQEFYILNNLNDLKNRLESINSL